MRSKEKMASGLDYISNSGGNEFVRKGITGEWRNYLAQEHITMIKERYGDLLIKLGYEKDNNW